MTHWSPMKLDQSCTVIFSQASKGKVLVSFGESQVEEVTWKSSDHFLRFYLRRMRCSKSLKV